MKTEKDFDSFQTKLVNFTNLPLLIDGGQDRHAGRVRWGMSW